VIRFFKNIWLSLRLTYAVLRLLINPNNLNPIFRVREFLGHKSFQFAINKTKSNSKIKEMMDDRYLTETPYDLKALISYPEGSLGQVFAKHMNFFKLDVVYYPDDIEDSTTSDISWIRQRSRETHDVWHCILGYKPDHLGEIKISSFFLQQTNAPLPAIIILVGILVAVIKKPHLLNELFESIIEGWQDAKKSKELLEVKWEELWLLPITDVRESLNISQRHETYEQESMKKLEKREIERFEKYKSLNEGKKDV
jgi:ubiquinone biosynthesis protein Coq4